MLIFFKNNLISIYFYFVTRYSDLNKTSGDGKIHFTNNSYPGLTKYSINLLLTRNSLDPVSEKEINQISIIFLKKARIYE